MLHPLSLDKAQTLTLELAPERPLVACDRERMGQIIGNLVGNAIKYAPRSATITVAIVATTLTVRDTGGGIAPEHLPRIFDRYWRAEQAARSASQGLGLFITKRLVEAQRGTITVESEPGSTTFRVALPAADQRVA